MPARAWRCLIGLIMSTFNWFLLSILSLLWGGAFFLNELALPLGSSLMIVFCRVAVGALVLWLLVFFRRIPVPSGWRIWCGFLVLGLLCNVLPFLLFVQAQRTLDSGVTATLNATTPLFTALIAHIFIVDERLKQRVILALLIASVGVWVLSGSPDLHSDARSTFWMPIAAAVCHGLAAVFARCIVKVQPEIAAAGVLTSSALICGLLLLLTDGWHDIHLSVQPVVAVVALGMCSTALAYLLYFRLLLNVGATALSLVTVLMPLSAMVLGFVFLHEVIDRRALLGTALVVLSLVVFNGWFELRSTGHSRPRGATLNYGSASFSSHRQRTKKKTTAEEPMKKSILTSA